MPYVNDGSVVPSHIRFEATPQYSNKDHFEDYGLRMGEVVKVIYPDDDASVTKQYIEYNIWCQYLPAGGVGQGRMYYAAICANNFASLADRSFQTFRPNEKAGNKQANSENPNDTPGLGLGSKVLFLCINGQTAYPIIISGLPDPKDKTQMDVDEGDIVQVRIFNGIEWYINNEGELLIKYNGKTEDTGKTEVDDSKVGTYFKLDQDGNSILSDKDEKNYFKLDHKNGELLFDREKKFKIGKADEAFVLGTTFRREMQTMNTKLQSGFKTLNTLMQNAATSAAIGSAKLIVPVYGPPNASADFAQMAAYMFSMSSILSQMSDALQAFEQKANDYLSTKNFGDK